MVGAGWQGGHQPDRQETSIAQHAGPEKKPIYYGWIIVGVIFLAGIASSAWMNNSLSVFLKPISTEFGWPRSAFSVSGLVGTLAGGVGALAIGPAIDRWGSKWILFAGCLGTGIIFVLLGQVHGFVFFFVLLVAGRFILQGILNVATAVVVPKWFIAQRGRAMAIATLGSRLGTGIIPLAVQLITIGLGWRVAATALGITAAALTVPAILLWLRRTPEDMGLLPDGVTPEEAQADQQKPKSGRFVVGDVAYTVKQVVRMPGFYLLLLAFGMNQFVSTGINFNLLPYLTDQGISPTHAALIVSVWSLMGIPGVLLGGYISERVPLRWVMVTVFAGVLAGNLILVQVHTAAMGLVFAMVQGSFFGSVLLYQTLVFANYYGRTSQGAIRGFIQPLLMIANAFGPLAATMVYDRYGSYLPIMNFYALIGVAVLVMAVLAMPPKARTEEKTQAA